MFLSVYVLNNNFYNSDIIKLINHSWLCFIILFYEWYYLLFQTLNTFVKKICISITFNNNKKNHILNTEKRKHLQLYLTESLRLAHGWRQPTINFQIMLNHTCLLFPNI